MNQQFGGYGYGSPWNGPQRQNPIESFKAFISSSNMLVRLIVINVAVWLIIRIIGVFLGLFNVEITSGLLQWLAVPADLSRLITRPWTIVTYMFLHYDFWHILFNMLWLYWFGKIFLEFLTERQLLAVYLLGGLSGALLYILSFNIFPAFQDSYLQSIALGASASVMAIVLGISIYVPDYRIYLMFFGPVRIIYIALASILLDVLMIGSTNSGGHLAHIGGALFGYLFIVQLRRGNDLSYWLTKMPRISLPRFSFGRKPRVKKVWSQPKRPVSDEEYNYEKARMQRRIDEILDKISKSGYESLTAEEKELLFRSSNRNHT
ncbi:MAG: rhomboid family intramembrane serine protease [Bacteroidales bacterium]